jgi:hypothetical protein
MDNIFMFALIVSIVFFIVKFIEMRFLDKEPKPLKFIVRDTLVVYFSVIFGNFILEQVEPMLNDGAEISKITPVFTDNPGF